MDNKNLIRIPLNGTFELTARCNLRCKMCLIRIDDKRMVELGGRERTAEEWIYMAGEALEAGTIGLLLTGGEPMLRPDFIQIYEAIAQMGFMLTLYTNATLITPKIMEVLKKYPPHRIGITTYGASPETYEKVTGNAKAYYRMMEGVEQLRQLPSKFTIRTTLIKDNIDDLNQITEWALKFGKDVDFNVSRIVTKPVRGGIADVESCRLTPEENVNMLKGRNIDFIIKPFSKFINDNPEIDYDSSNAEQKSKLYSISDSKYKYTEEIQTKKKSTLYGCAAGINSYTISWDGKMIGCQMLGDCWAYPFEDGFKQAWDDYPMKVNSVPIPKQCIGCNINCSACPATRLAETGYLGGFPEYLCRESKLANEMQEKLKEEIDLIINKKGRKEYETIRIT